MSQYLILIYGQEAEYAHITGERMAEIMAGHEAFGRNHGDAIVAGNSLQPPSTATTVRQDGAGGHTVTDGPFVETKEALGGYYLIEAADRDEVLAMAREIPTVGGGVEVRSIQVFA